MKFDPSVVSYFLLDPGNKRNIRSLLRFVLVLGVMVVVFSVTFHVLMAIEGQDHSWITGFYWTLTVMTTLGFGDITFHSDLGRVFSIVVLLSGVVFLLTLLPFTFIKFFYAPWMEAESRNRAPKELPPTTTGHVILTSEGPVTSALIEKLRDHRREYVLLVEDFVHALELHDDGVRVAVGAIDDPETYRRLRVDHASLVVATSRDELNTNIAFTVRELNEQVPIVTTADSPFSEDILRAAGSSRVLQIHEILGRSLATWTLAGECRANVITQIGELLIAESPAIGTPLVGKTLAESRLREDLGVAAVGIWERGQFRIPNASSRIDRSTVLVLAGSKESLAAFDGLYSACHVDALSQNPVLIVGGGRVGRAVARYFKEKRVSYLIIEKTPPEGEPEEHDSFVVGDAADIRTLQKAWIEKAPAALITTHDDATNIYLTKYLRSLRPDIQLLSRASMERNVSTLHRAGADFVMSYASLGANAIFNFSRNEDTLFLAEGLNIFRVKAPQSLVGKDLTESGIRARTGCSVVATKLDGALSINPDPRAPIRKDTELILIGTYEGERKILQWTDA